MAITITYSIRDGKGKAGQCSVKIPETTSTQDTKEFAQEMGELIVALIDGEVTNISAAIDVDLTAGILAQSAAANSDREEGAQFNFSVQGGFYTGTRIPTFKESLMVSGDEDVDVAQQAVDDFVDAMVNGITLTSTATVAPCDMRDTGITGLSSAYDAFQRSRTSRR